MGGQAQCSAGRPAVASTATSTRRDARNRPVTTVGNWQPTALQRLSRSVGGTPQCRRCGRLTQTLLMGREFTLPRNFKLARTRVPRGGLLRCKAFVPGMVGRTPQGVQGRHFPALLRSASGPCIAGTRKFAHPRSTPLNAQSRRMRKDARQNKVSNLIGTTMRRKRVIPFAMEGMPLEIDRG